MANGEIGFFWLVNCVYSFNVDNKTPMKESVLLFRVDTMSRVRVSPVLGCAVVDVYLRALCNRLVVTFFYTHVWIHLRVYVRVVFWWRRGWRFFSCMQVHLWVCVDDVEVEEFPRVCRKLAGCQSVLTDAQVRVCTYWCLFVFLLFISPIRLSTRVFACLPPQLPPLSFSISISLCLVIVVMWTSMGTTRLYFIWIFMQDAASVKS